MSTAYDPAPVLVLASNAALVKRQDTLAEAWDAYVKGSPSDDKDTFHKGWLAARKAALAVVDAQNNRVDQLRAALTTP